MAVDSDRASGPSGEPQPLWPNGAFSANTITQVLLQNTAVAVFVKNLDGRYVYVNSTCERLWMRAAKDIIGRRDADLLPGHVAEQLSANDREVATSGLAAEFEERIPFPECDKVFRTCKMPFRDDDGQVVAICGLATDVSQSRATEESLRNTRERLRRIQNVAGIGAYLLDADGNIVQANETFAKMIGYERHELERQQIRWQTLTPPEYRSITAEQLRRLRDDGYIEPYEKEFIRKDGSRLWLLFVGTALGDGTIMKYCMDISVYKETEKALREADRAKDEFLAILGHELRNPLAPLRHGIDLMRQAAAQPQLMLSLQPMMERQIAHLTRLVDDLLDMSRISGGKIDLRRDVVDVNVVVQAAVEQTRPAVNRRRHELSIRRSDEDLTVTGDFDRLTQVVANLLFNAVNYTEQGGSILVIAERAGDQAVVRVRDTGVGIPDDRRDKLFKLFSKIPENQDPATTSGLGIGLAVSRELVEMHGGTIAVSSEGIGKGSEFVVRLPLCTEAATPREEMPAASTPRVKRRLLIVDDNRDAAESLGMLMEQRGHVVTTVHDGETALSCFERGEFDVVLLDIGLPDVDGVEVGRRIRVMPNGQSVELIAITGWGQDRDRRRTMAAGFDLHLTKPVDMRLLCRCLEQTETPSRSDRNDAAD